MLNEYWTIQFLDVLEKKLTQIFDESKWEAPRYSKKNNDYYSICPLAELWFNRYVLYILANGRENVEWVIRLSG